MLRGCVCGYVRKKALLQCLCNYCEEGYGPYEVPLSLLGFGMGNILVQEGLCGLGD